MNLKLIIFKAFKVGVCFNIFSIFTVIFYILFIENYARPFDFKSPIEFGTAVSGLKIFNTLDASDFNFSPGWAKIESKFDLFLSEHQLQPYWVKPIPRFQKWCKTRNCCAHRIGFNDKKIANFKCFTLDDWYLTNRDFLGSELDKTAVAILHGFLTKLPAGSRVIISEPYMLFADRRSFDSFTRWVLALRAKYPALRFEIGLQIHLQTFDSYWFQYQWLVPALGEFSRQHRIPWGVSEFSIYDRLWKSRIAYGGATPSKTFLVEFESIFPDRFRYAVTLHQAYIFHRDVVRYGASFVVEWGNFPTTWFAVAIAPDYTSTFALADWDGKLQPMYWAIARGLTDGKPKLP
ncbi:MAG: hypothetical protein EAZ09_06750 [Oscillatoriales cyanobacterium]|nr:MAG: hypothetical protein EAZ18_05795 [Oscillatoriales cyanobacterium]TAH23541.1 MAG: hypothetical protein EAZ09_06750 [Oscillatoriales cyanobacterium]